MPGSSTRTAAWPQPVELLARLLIASALVLWLAHAFERALVEPMLPVFSSVIPALDDEFTILATDISEDGPSKAVRFRVNLARPVDVGGRTLYPFGWGTIPAGEFQVTITVGGVLQYCVLVFVLIFAWPVLRAREYCLRVAIAAPLMAVLLLVHVPLTVLAELWHGIRAETDPGGLQSLMIWSRFLMGGGGLALGVLFGGLAIALAARLSALIKHRSGTLERKNSGPPSEPGLLPQRMSRCSVGKKDEICRIRWRRSPGSRR